MTVLLLNQAFYPDIAATAQQATDLAVRLVERGHDVTVICSRRAYDNPGERYPRRETWRGVKIRRISSVTLGKHARWRRAVTFGSYLVNCLTRLALLPRADLVIAMTSPPLISSLGACFTRFKGGRFIFWVMDLNPDEALAAGWLRPGSSITAALQKLLQYGLNRATTIVTLDRHMAKRIESKGVAPARISVLPPWARDHVVRYDASGRARFRATHGLADKFVVMYAGNHSPCHPLTTLLTAAERLRQREDIVFCFVGGGSEVATVRQLAAARRLQNIKILPYQPMAALGASLSAADLHVVVMGEPFVGIVHPCKVYNIEMLGLPYIYIGPAESHISERRPTFAARHGDPDAVVRHVEAAARDLRDRTPLTVPVPAHSHDRLVTRLAMVLEAAAAGMTNAHDTEGASLNDSHLRPAEVADHATIEGTV
jgi:glycosyltransferase involved in cell wall biosynthesis